MTPEIQELIEEMCDHYCYFDHICTDEDVLMKHCEECPLTKIRMILEEKHER